MKIHMFNMVTLDGFFEGPNRDIDWHRADEEFNKFSIEQVKTADGLIFGRVTYELQATGRLTLHGQTIRRSLRR